MNFQTPFPTQPNFPALEEEILDWWQKNDIVHKYLQKNSDSKKSFSFIDGPITANGPMGVHHARGRTYKDLFQRYKNANGFAQRFQNGFDCQGLWVEVEVEKENGFNSKKDIQNFGLDKFTKSCLDRVNHFSSLQTDQSVRLGMFMDWENSYYTNSKTNNLYIWHFLKVINQKGWLVKKKSATTWCPRCETGLSQHEEADGYKETTDTSVYVKFKIDNSQNDYLLAWTTTPWTLSANVLLAINPRHTYVVAKHNGQNIYLAKQAAERLGLSNYQVIDPNLLLNKSYLPSFPSPAQQNIKHFVTSWDLVDPSEGTGIVHIAPGCGQEDFELGKKLSTEMIAPLDETGHFLPNFGELSGLYAHDVTPQVISSLEKQGLLFKTEAIRHRYPHCWRCKTKCLFRLEDSWYISSDHIRPLMKEAASKVNWYPKYVGRRMQNWLDSMEDWMISRKRFYGLSLPFYQCGCGHLSVVGSLEELKSLAINPEKVDTLSTLHRPWIDEIIIRCPKCNQNVNRIPDVGDCWLDAGVVPFSTLKYLSDKKYWQKWFPANLVLEMIEQVRLWFYSMLFFSVTFENTPPYQHVVTHAEVRDENGERMSKTKKNGIPFDQAISKMGADSMRWLYCQQKPYSNVNFGFNIADQVKREFLLILWNSYRFYREKVSTTSPDPNDPVPTDITDQWLLSRLNHTIKTVSTNLDKYEIAKSTKTIEEFVNDLSTWYIRQNRQRSDNLTLLHQCFDQLFRLLAPFIPFISDYLYLDLTQKNQSVHLQSWPAYSDKMINTKLETQMKMIRQICQLIHQKRQLAQIKIRQPLSQAIIYCPSSLDNFGFDQIIISETNVKKISWINVPNDQNISVDLDVTLTPQLIEEGEHRDLVRTIQLLRRQQGLKVTDRIKLYLPSWNQKLQDELLKKTGAISVENSPEIRIELLNEPNHQV